jgi:hypothetical protein
MHRLLLPALFVLAPLASGCETSITPAGAQVREAAPESVTNCVFLGTVFGSASSFDWKLPTVENAQSDALNRAGDMGATHIVWTSLSGGRGPVALARVYRCSAAGHDAAHQTRNVQQ